MGYIFEKGSEVDVGFHGEHDYVYASGEPIPDTGNSEVVFESGTGLGGNDVFHFDYGNVDEFSAWHSDAEDALNVRIRAADFNSTTFADAYANEPTIVLSARDRNGFSVSSEELAAFSEAWDNGASVLVLGEDDADQSGSNRAEAMGEYVNTALGTDGFDVNDVASGGDDSCESNLPSNHPVFNGVSAIYRRRTELPILNNPSPLTALSTDSENVWADYDSGDGQRMFLSGAVHTFDSNSGNYPECADDPTYTVQALEWVIG